MSILALAATVIALATPTPDPTLVPAFTTITPEQLTIVLSDDLDEVKSGEAVRFAVTVDSLVGQDTPITVRVVAPAGITDVSADGATIIANTISWKATAKPNSKLTYSVTGKVAEGVSGDLSTIACVHVPTSAKAINCATDVDTVGQGWVRFLPWAGSAVLLAAGLGGWLWFRRRKAVTAHSA